MSQYLHFFARKGDVFTPLLTVLSDDESYTYIADLAPYARVTRLTTSDIDRAHSSIQDDILYYQKLISRTRAMITSLERCAGAFSDKYEDFYQFNKQIEEYEQGLVSLNKAQTNLALWGDCIRTMEIIEEEERDVDGTTPLGIYIGVECGDIILPSQIS